MGQGKKTSATKSLWWVPVGIFCCALLARLIFLVENLNIPFFNYRGIDAQQYHEMAVSFLNGRWPGEQVLSWPPLYTLFLGLFYKTIGQSATILRIFHAILGSVSCVLVYFIARTVFSRRFVPIAAALICCLCGTMIYFDSQLLPGSLDVLLELLIIFSLLFASRRRWMGWWLLAGFFVGLSAVNRGGIILFVPIILLWMYMVSRHGWGIEGKSERPAFWKAAILLLLPVGLIVFPVVLHNVRYNEGAVGKEPKPLGLMQFVSTGFLPIASNLGINFYLGNHWELREINNINHPEHFVYYHRIENEPTENGIEGALGESRYLVRRTVSHIFEKPGDFIRLMGLKVFQLFNGAEIPRNANLYAFRKYSVVLSILLWKRIIAFPSGLIIPLGLVGIFLSRDLWRKHFLLFGCLAVQYLFILAFFVTARYRMPTIPLLAVYAAFAVEAFVRYVRQGAKRKAAIPVFLLVVLVLFSNSPMGRIETEHGYSEYLNLGNALHDEGKIEEAILCFNETLRLAPNYPKAHYNLANALTDKGMLTEAVMHYNRALELQPDYLEAQSNLAKALAKQGRLQEAIELWEQLVQINPAESVLHSNLGTAYHRLGQFDKAIMHWNQVLRLTPNHVSVLNKLAWLLATCQDAKYRDPVRAVELAERGCTLTAYRVPKLLDSLAAAYARAGRFGQAVGTAERALEVSRASGAKQLEADIAKRLQMYRRKQAYYE